MFYWAEGGELCFNRNQVRRQLPTFSDVCNIAEHWATLLPVTSHTFTVVLYRCNIIKVYRIWVLSHLVVFIKKWENCKLVAKYIKWLNASKLNTLSDVARIFMKEVINYIEHVLISTNASPPRMLDPKPLLFKKNCS